VKTIHFPSRVLAVAAVLLGATACAPTTPNLDRSFGRSLSTLKAYQTAYPDASRNPDNPALDGVAAAEAMARYEKSFSAPAPQQNVFTIGVGGGVQ
jgi:hypothetical protein